MRFNVQRITGWFLAGRFKEGEFRREWLSPYLSRQVIFEMGEDGCSVDFLCKGDSVTVGECYRTCTFYPGRFVDQLARLYQFNGSRLGQPFDFSSSLLPAYLSAENVLGFGKRLECGVRVDGIRLYCVPERLGEIS